MCNDAPSVYNIKTFLKEVKRDDLLTYTFPSKKNLHKGSITHFFANLL